MRNKATNYKVAYIHSLPLLYPRSIFFRGVMFHYQDHPIFFGYLYLVWHEFFFLGNTYKKRFLITKDFLIHTNPSHPENAQRLIAIQNFLQETYFFDDLSVIDPLPVKEIDLEKIHSLAMINHVKNADGWIDADTYVLPQSYDIACLAAGGVVEACRCVAEGKVDNAFAIVRPPGHHATSSRSMGFCLFNNIALAADRLTRKGFRVLVFDHDLHHGNGTCSIFYDRSDILYESFHLFPYYPGTGTVGEIGHGQGEGFTVNAPLPYGTGNQGVRKILDDIMLPIAEQFHPDIILFSSGFDSHHADPLGGLSLTINFFGEMVKFFRKIQDKIVCSLEGGYDLDSLKKSVAVQIGELNNTPLQIRDNTRETGNVIPVINQLKDTLQPYWAL